MFGVGTGFPHPKELLMARRSGHPRRAPAHRHEPERIAEFREFLSPQAVFSNPFEVVDEPSLGVGEKRAILARWLACICAAEAALGLKWMPTTSPDPMEFDDVMDAMRALEPGAPDRPSMRMADRTETALHPKWQKSARIIH